MKLEEQYPIENIKQNVKVAYDVRSFNRQVKQAKTRALVDLLRKNGVPDNEPLAGQFISKEKHREIIGKALSRYIERAREQGHLCFSVSFDAEDSDHNGSVEDESGSYFHRALFARNLLRAHGIENAEFYDKETFAILVVVI